MSVIATIFWASYFVCLLLWYTGAAFVGVSGWMFFWAALIPMAISIVLLVGFLIIMGIVATRGTVRFK